MRFIERKQWQNCNFNQTLIERQIKIGYFQICFAKDKYIVKIFVTNIFEICFEI